MSTPLSCQQMAESLTDLMEGDLDEATEQLALEHLASCTACESVLSATRQVTDLARHHGRTTLSRAERDRLWGRVRDEAG